VKGGGSGVSVIVQRAVGHGVHRQDMPEVMAALPL